MGIFAYLGVMELFPYSSTLRILSIFTLAPLFFFFLTFVHEMGHAIPAWAFGHRVHVITVGKIGFVPAHRKFIKVKISNDKELGGFVSHSPIWPFENKRWKEFLISLGGPLSTALLGGVFLLINYFDIMPDYVYATLPLLAAACFLSTLVNLLPFRWGGEFDSDGRSMAKSLFESQWTNEQWAASRLFAWHYGQQEIVSREEWRELRKLCSKTYPPHSNIAALLHYCAWVQTDPEAFVAISDSVEFNQYTTDETQDWRYAAMRVLAGSYDQTLDSLIPEALPVGTIKENASIYYFARAIVSYAQGRDEAARRATDAARASYKDIQGDTPHEETQIFEAIENKRPLPDLKWPRLGSLAP